MIELKKSIYERVNCVQDKPASNLIQKAKNTVRLAKKYWNVPPKGKYISYKEVASLSGAGFGVHWTTLLASTIGLNASNFLVGASIGLSPMDLQIMLTVANLIGLNIHIIAATGFESVC